MKETTVADVINRRPPPDPRMYGVEFEVERASARDLPGWRVVGDGSLRNDGVEYIFDGPASYADSVSLVRVLGDMLDSVCDATHFVHTTRTSIHIHANASDLTLAQLKKLVRIYTLVEAEAFARWGAGRDATPYCVPLRDSDRYLQRLVVATELADIVSHFQGRGSKYSAFSLCRIIDLGTVEFRLFAGTNDVQRILEYLEFVHIMMLGAVSDRAELDVIHSLSELFAFTIDYEEAALWLSVLDMLHTARTTSISPRSRKSNKGWRRYNLFNTQREAVTGGIGHMTPEQLARTLRSARAPTPRPARVREIQGVDAAAEPPISAMDSAIIHDARMRGRPWNERDVAHYATGAGLSREYIMDLLSRHVPRGDE